MVSAKKKPTSLTRGETFSCLVPSRTQGEEFNLVVDETQLNEADRVIVVDDFFARGFTSKGLADIVQQSGAQLMAIVAVIGKEFEGGENEIRHSLDANYVDKQPPLVFSLITIKSMNPETGEIVFG